MKIGEQTIIFLAVNKNGDEIILDNTPARQGEIWTDERSTHDEEYFSIEDHNSAIVLPKGTIRRLTGRDLKWEDDPISLKSKSVIDKFPHADIEFYKQKKFVTEYQINGKKYAGEIWATSWEEAECFIKQRASTEKAVGFIPKD